MGKGTISNHFLGTHYQNMITINDISFFIYAKAAVSITIMGDTKICPKAHYSLLNTVHVGGTAVIINISAIWRIIKNDNIGTKAVKNHWHYLIGCTVGTIQYNLHSVKTLLAGGQDEILVLINVVMTIINITHLCTSGTWEIITSLNLSYDCLQLVLHRIRQFIAIAAEELNTIVVEWIMRCRNNNTAVSVLFLRKICNSWSWDNANNNCTATGRTNTSTQSSLKHLTGNSGITADENFWHRFRIFTKIQSCRPAQTICQFRSQLNICLSTHAISTK